MNDILYLNGHFEQRSNMTKVVGRSLTRHSKVTENHVTELTAQLRTILDFWKNNTLIEGALLSVHYGRIIPKSHRLCRLLSVGSESPSDSVKGARFEENGNSLVHVFTYYIPLSALKKTIELLEITGNILSSHYDTGFTDDDFEYIKNEKKFPFKHFISKTAFLETIFDASHVDYFSIDTIPDINDQESVLSIYKTESKTIPLLGKLGINITPDRMLDDTTIRLYSNEIQILKNTAPYLISMGVTDVNELSPFEIIESDELYEENQPIPHPENEPVIGVIDSYFNTSAYFSEWVDNRITIEPMTDISYNDMAHGTAVDSIIVDGPRLNPFLEDGCGRFKVRHFGICGANGFSSFTFTKMIRSIVQDNSDIRVWNISLGSAAETKKFSISPAAAELDKIQCEFDVIFVIAGTNKPTGNTEIKRIGSPADSLNSVVVNAVDSDRKPTSYTRTGPVLCFFNKPDISYYGGDKLTYDYISVDFGNGITRKVRGTSFAAPWITRKLAYMINIMGLSREVAKALLIDTAAGWQTSTKDISTIGYGVVPIHIKNIISSPEDEIRFILTGAAEDYETYTYGIPVPIINDTQPFYARATLVYFPQCNRSQGVDYTNTELDIHFGRLSCRNGRTQIKSLNANTQADYGNNYIYEEAARSEFRKWDNVKYICDIIKPRRIARKVMESGLWGLSIKTKERLSNKHKDPIPFAVVITLKEMNGKNRIDDFIKLCMAKGWFVKSINQKGQFDIYTKAEEVIEFE